VGEGSSFKKKEMARQLRLNRKLGEGIKQGEHAGAVQGRGGWSVEGGLSRTIKIKGVRYEREVFIIPYWQQDDSSIYELWGAGAY